MDEEYDEYWNSDEISSISERYYEATNITYSAYTLVFFVAAYCAELKIPLNASLFDDIVTTSRELSKLYWRSEYYAYNSTNGTKKESKYQVYKLVSSPQRYIISQYISNATTQEELETSSDNNNNNDDYQFVYHSMHDSSILELLGGLGITDGTWPIFAEMLVLEIYKMNNNNNSSINFDSGFGFRLMRNGNVLKFENCSNMIENEMELCDLDVLMTILKDDAMPLKEWEDYVYDFFNGDSSSSTTGTSSGTSTTTGEPVTVASTENGCDTGHSDSEIRMSALLEGVFIGIGISLAMLGVVMLITVCWYRKKKAREVEENVYNHF